MAARPGPDYRSRSAGRCDYDCAVGESWVDKADEAEMPLAGGDVTEGVVRVGNTVRRPVRPHSPLVHALLAHLESAGFEGAPRFLGIDGSGREVLSYIDGEVAGPPASGLDRRRDPAGVGRTAGPRLRRRGCLVHSSAGHRPDTRLPSRRESRPPRRIRRS